MNERITKGYSIALLATLLWSFTGILISYLNKNYSLPSLVLAFWRDLFVALGLGLVFLLVSRRRFAMPRAEWGFLILYGLVLAVFNSMWTFSVQFNGAAVATVLAFSSPAMTAILESLFLKTRLNRIEWVSIGISFIGTALVAGAFNPQVWQLNLPGITFGLLTGLFFAFYNLMGKRSANQSLDSWSVLFYSFGIATVFLFGFNLLFDGLQAKPLLGELLWLGNSVPGWLILFFLGVGPTVGGFGLYTLSMHYLPATTSNLIATLEPALTAIWAYFILSEVLTGEQLLGGGLILAGVVLLRWNEGKSE